MEQVIGITIAQQNDFYIQRDGFRLKGNGGIRIDHLIQGFDFYFFTIQGALQSIPCIGHG